MKPGINLLLQKTASGLSKKLFIAAIALVCLTTSAFAPGDEASERAAKRLKSEYKNAQDIQWKVTNDFIKASFYWNEQYVEVFYDKDGETIAEGRLIRVKNLPIKAQQYLNEKYADYAITEAIEYTSEQTGLCYYVSISKDGGKTKILQITPTGEVSLFNH
jgi:hypothetical protein